GQLEVEPRDVGGVVAAGEARRVARGKTWVARILRDVVDRPMEAADADISPGAEGVAQRPVRAGGEGITAEEGDRMTRLGRPVDREIAVAGEPSQRVFRPGIEYGAPVDRHILDRPAEKRGIPGDDRLGPDGRRDDGRDRDEREEAPCCGT